MIKLINLIKCFEKKDQLYWIQRLFVSDSAKGQLIIYFNL